MGKVDGTHKQQLEEKERVEAKHGALFDIPQLLWKYHLANHWVPSAIWLPYLGWEAVLRNR